MVFEGPGPPIFNYFCNCFRTPSRTSFLVFFCRFVERQGSRFGASGPHFLTPKKRSEKSHASVCGCMRHRGGGCPTKIKDMPIRDGFPHQFTPAVPKGTVADLKAQCITGTRRCAIEVRHGNKYLSSLSKIDCEQ